MTTAGALWQGSRSKASQRTCLHLPAQRPSRHLPTSPSDTVRKHTNTQRQEEEEKQQKRFSVLHVCKNAQKFKWVDLTYQFSSFAVKSLNVHGGKCNTI